MNQTACHMVMSLGAMGLTQHLCGQGKMKGKLKFGCKGTRTVPLCLDLDQEKHISL